MNIDYIHFYTDQMNFELDLVKDKLVQLCQKNQT